VIAVITAGGLVGSPFSDEIRTRVKALAPLLEGRLIDRALDAARSCGASFISVVGTDEVLSHCGGRIDAFIPAREDGGSNLEAALRSAREGEPLLFLTSDLPFITPAALADFLERVGDAHLAMPVASEPAYVAAYPGAANHITNLNGERIANGSVFFFSPGAALQTIAYGRRFFEARKSLTRMAALLDLPLMLRFLFRRLRIEHIEAYAARKLGLDARVVRDASPALCYDIDTFEDYRYALRLLEKQGLS
jgi:CTP:molybdopterin cytidylyltransferase MocA